LALRRPGRRPAGYSGLAAAGSLGRTRSSWLRELMASLAKTLSLGGVALAEQGAGAGLDPSAPDLVTPRSLESGPGA
jgi:hypothetical protein